MPAKITGHALYTVPTQNIVHLMSMEDMYVSMYDTPELFKKVMDRLTDDYCRYFDLLEEAGHLLPTVSSQGLGLYGFSGNGGHFAGNVRGICFSVL